MRASLIGLLVVGGCSRAAAPSPPPDATATASSAKVDVEDGAADALADLEAKENTAVRSAATLADAIEAVRPKLEEHADGNALAVEALQITSYWGDRFLWSDVITPKVENSFGLIRKDPAGTVGRRVCVRARVDRIKALEKRSAINSPSFSADLHSADGRWVALAVRSTGSIVGGSAATFCGIAVGTFYDSGDKMFEPVLIGMFDLPENRKP